MMVLGVDPGTVATGFGVIRRDGSRFTCLYEGDVRTPAKAPMPERLHRIYTAVAELIETYRPDEVSVEDTFVSKNPQTAIKLGQARGVILLACAQARLSVTDYAPTAVKRAIVGYGGADKEQMIFMIQRLLNLPEPPASDHAADALGLALCHLSWMHHNRMTAPTKGEAAQSGSTSFARKSPRSQQAGR